VVEAGPTIGWGTAMSESLDISSVAVIGVGAMGGPMARRLLAAGFRVTVYDRNLSALEPLAVAGARIASDAATCADCDLVIVIVATSQQAEQVLLGERGLREGVRPNHTPLVAVMATMSPDAIRRLDDALSACGMRLIDAPVSGGPLRAERGTLSIMTGGDPKVVAVADAVFGHIGSHRSYCGTVGAAQTVKLLNNIIGVANSLVAAEAYRLAVEQGLDLVHVARVFETGTGRNFVSADPAGPAPTYEAMTRSRQGFDGLVAVMRKDIGLASAIAEQLPGTYPALKALQALLERVGDESWMNWQRVGQARGADPQ
jgi:3-hydroxyisobutyrate dehydrogenase